MLGQYTNIDPEKVTLATFGSPILYLFSSKSKEILMFLSPLVYAHVSEVNIGFFILTYA